MECHVERALAALLAGGTLPTAQRVAAIVAPAEPEIPAMVAPLVDLHVFDELLACTEAVAS